MGIMVSLDNAEDCITGSPFGERHRILGRERDACCDISTYVIKYDKAAVVQSWSTRLADTQQLLETIGTDKEISQIMGVLPRCREGSRRIQVFVITETQREEADGSMVGLFRTCRARWCLCGVSDHGAVHECDTRSRRHVTNIHF